MNEQGWKRVEYESWDEAFRALAPAVRQQSVRVASYTQVLFLQACADGFGRDIPGGENQMRGQYGDLAYKCGMYHQLGKALVPPEYQLWRDDFTEEEKAVYRKYAADGRALIMALQQRSLRAREKRVGQLLDDEGENIPWQMQRDSCQQHMERYDGSGYPDGRRGTEISPVAQIVGIARELDRLVSETKSEDPFGEAFDTLYAGSGTLWSPELIEVLKHSRDKCRNIYHKYIHYSMTLPKTIPLVEKRKDRPMGLRYRPMMDGENNIVAYEAIPWFGGIAGQPGETEGAEGIAEILQRTGMTADVMFYLLYEAADTVLRMQNCKLSLRGVLVQTLPGFYSRESYLQQFQQLFEDQPIDRGRLMLTVPTADVAGGTKGMREILGRYLRAGIVLVLDDYDPTILPLETVDELGFRHLRFRRELYLQPATAKMMCDLRDAGYTLLGKEADSEDVLRWLAASGVMGAGGPITGVPVEEEELIRDSLLRER